jgi:hypothetical protein
VPPDHGLRLTYELPILFVEGALANAVVELNNHHEGDIAANGLRNQVCLLDLVTIEALPSNQVIFQFVPILVVCHIQSQLATEHEDFKGEDILRLEVLLIQMQIVREEPGIGLDADEAHYSLTPHHQHYVTVHLCGIVE